TLALLGKRSRAAGLVALGRLEFGTGGLRLRQACMAGKEEGAGHVYGKGFHGGRSFRPVFTCCYVKPIPCPSLEAAQNRGTVLALSQRKGARWCAGHNNGGQTGTGSLLMLKRFSSLYPSDIGA